MHRRKVEKPMTAIPKTYLRPALLDPHIPYNEIRTF